MDSPDCLRSWASESTNAIHLSVESAQPLTRLAIPNPDPGRLGRETRMRAYIWFRAGLPNAGRSRKRGEWGATILTLHVRVHTVERERDRSSKIKTRDAILRLRRSSSQEKPAYLFVFACCAVHYCLYYCVSPSCQFRLYAALLHLAFDDRI